MIYQYLPDVESDMSVFHRVDDVRSLPAQLLVDRAVRLGAYRGMMRDRITAEQYEAQETPSSSVGSTKHDNTRRTVSSDAGTLATDPGLGGMFETRRAAADAGQGIQTS